MKPTASKEVVISFIEGENAGSELKVEAPKDLIVGRSEQCDIFIGERKVSRKHARLLVQTEGVFIEDLDSTNGTFVEGKKVGSAKLKDGETVRIGMTVFRVSMQDKPASSPQLPEDKSQKVQPGTRETSGHDLLNESPEMEVAENGEAVGREASGEKDKPQDKKKPLSGNLSEMPLPDLLQMLKNNKTSGTIEISVNGGGGVAFKDGVLIDAYCGNLHGLKAVYRMLSFGSGNFELKGLPESFNPEAVEEKIELSLENILIEGMRQMDEFEKIKKDIPKFNESLELNKGCSAPLRKLHPKVLDVLQLIINHGTFSEVMDKSPLSDLETGKIVYYLLKKGYVRIVTSDE